MANTDRQGILKHFFFSGGQDRSPALFQCRTHDKTSPFSRSVTNLHACIWMAEKISLFCSDAAQPTQKFTLMLHSGTANPHTSHEHHHHPILMDFGCYQWVIKLLTALKPVLWLYLTDEWKLGRGLVRPARILAATDNRSAETWWILQRYFLQYLLKRWVSDGWSLWLQNKRGDISRMCQNY